MKQIHIDFKGHTTDCNAEVEIEGMADSWTAVAKVTGHPSIRELNILYRLGEFLRPMFASSENLTFFSPLLAAIEREAVLILPRE